ncbi:MAG: hypothetical protein HY904_07575 [Deltaproteobacteria bacterium]|nr:hypothetical protein [Deltaproteobacteria bacterium]
MMRTALWTLANVAGLLSLGAQVTARLPPADPLVVIIPVGEVPWEYADAVQEALAGRLDARVVVAEGAEIPEEAWVEELERADADALTALGESLAPPDAWKVVVLTQAPLMRHAWEGPELMVGSGQVRGRACVVSLARLLERSASEEGAARRLADLALHEVGHTLGLRHCSVPGCVMGMSEGDIVAWADLRRNGYCPLCHLHGPGGVLREARWDGSPAR